MRASSSSAIDGGQESGAGVAGVAVASFIRRARACRLFAFFLAPPGRGTQGPRANGLASRNRSNPIRPASSALLVGLPRADPDAPEAVQASVTEPAALHASAGSDAVRVSVTSAAARASAMSAAEVALAWPRGRLLLEGSGIDRPCRASPHLS